MGFQRNNIAALVGKNAAAKENGQKKKTCCRKCDIAFPAFFFCAQMNQIFTVRQREFSRSAVFRENIE